MNFKTHNQQAINTGGTHLQGYVQANYKDLVAAFGKPMDGDGIKVDAEWNIQFDDGTIATIYNWKNGLAYMSDLGLDTERITDWNIGGASPRSAELVTIALDLHRESAAAPTDPIERALEPADDIRRSLVAVRGEAYAKLVEIGVMTHKQVKLVNFLASCLMETAEGFDKEQHEQVGQIMALMCARCLTLASKIYAPNSGDLDAKELTEWIDRITDAEDAAAGTIEQELFGKEGDDE